MLNAIDTTDNDNPNPKGPNVGEHRRTVLRCKLREKNPEKKKKEKITKSKNELPTPRRQEHTTRDAIWRTASGCANIEFQSA